MPEGGRRTGADLADVLAHVFLLGQGDDQGGAVLVVGVLDLDAFVVGHVVVAGAQVFVVDPLFPLPTQHHGPCRATREKESNHSNVACQTYTRIVGSTRKENPNQSKESCC